ncbi:MAG: glycosyltransferase family 2 protein [Anaerolineae bacterium]|nr:glycosyltransferase family 2 protein [Anaerolineae bacterium]
MLDLSIIIVSWNVRDLLRNCLHSIEQGRGALTLEVIVVDSHSHDGSPEMVAEEFPWVQLIACQENVGFPRGNNIGMEKARGRALMLLNPDTVVVGDALATMMAYLAAHPGVGVIGPQLRYGDGTIQSSRRRFPRYLTAFFEATWLQGYAPAHLLSHYYAQDIRDDEIAPVDWVMGACMLVRREAMERAGMMDVGYFMYSEELDWCKRIKAAGFAVIYLPTAQIIHYEGKSSEQAGAKKHIYFHRAKLRYFRKYYGRGAAAILRLFLLLNYAWQLIIESAKWLVGHKRELRWQRIQTHWQVLRSGLPPAGYDS